MNMIIQNVIKLSLKILRSNLWFGLYLHENPSILLPTSFLVLVTFLKNTYLIPEIWMEEFEFLGFIFDSDSFSLGCKLTCSNLVKCGLPLKAPPLHSGLEFSASIKLH